MFLYRAVNKMVLSRSYLGKILFVSFLGVHIPIIGAVSYVLLASEGGLMGSLDIVIAMLVATMVGTGATLVIHHGLLAPVRNAATALNAYLETKSVPTLPTKYRDEAGILMANVQESITRLDAALDAVQVEREIEARYLKAKLELFSGMSHELRTPLNHIVGFAEMMSNEVLGPLGGDKYKDYASNIGRSGGDLMETMKTLMEIGRAEAEAELAPESVSLVETIETAIATSHFHAERTGIALTKGILDTTLKLHVDPRATKQALGHMMQAAIATSGPDSSVLVDGRISETNGKSDITLTCDARPWVLDDVPPELRSAELDARAYSAANDAGEINSVSPVAVSLSLVSTLARLNGGTLKVGYDTNKRRVLSIELPLADLSAVNAA